MKNEHQSGHTESIEAEAIKSMEAVVIERTRENTRVRPFYLGIGLEKWAEELYEAVEVLGIKGASVRMAEAAATMYEESEGKVYLLPNKTLAYEIEYHIAAYFYAIGKKEYFWRRHITTWVFTKKQLERHCRDIDIYYNGQKYPIWSGNFWEGILFGYPRGKGGDPDR